MLNTLLNAIYAALAYAFKTVIDAFHAVGLEWAAVVGALAVLSVVLRSFFRVFVGDALVVTGENVRDSVSYRAKFDKPGKAGKRYVGKYTKIKGVSGNRANR